MKRAWEGDSQTQRHIYMHVHAHIPHTHAHTHSGIDESLLSPHASAHAEETLDKPPRTHGSFPSTVARTNVSPFFSMCASVWAAG